jgi:putative ABC transport system permease protein
MALLNRVAAGLRRLLRRARAEQDMDDELREFLEASIERKTQMGMSREAARRAARLELGSAEAVKDQIRDIGWESIVEQVIQDVRYAYRSVRKAPGLTAVTVATLALGIGANTAIFQLADAIRLRPLPVQHPDQLVEIRMVNPDRGRMGTFAGRRPLFTNALWEELHNRQQAFSGVLAWGAYPVNLSNRGEAQFAQGLWVSGDFFSVLGVAPYRGRLLTSNDDRPGCGSPAAVLGYDFWRRQFGGDGGVIGKTLLLDGHPFEIVGVAPRRFTGLEVGRTFDVATPICAERILNPEQSALNDKAWWWLTVIGRLAPGSSVERASTHLAAISPGIFQTTVASGLPPEVAHAYLGSTLKAFPASTGVSGTVREDYGTPLWVLLAVAGVVLIIASANIATLLLARATTREREIAVRLALGASRGRLIRQLLAESVLLAVAGAAVGMLLSQTLSEGLVGLLRTSGFQFFGVTFNLDPNWRVLFFATAVTLVTCVLFGVAPALLATRPSNGTLLRASARTTTDDRRPSGARSGLVVAQVALSLALVVTALLFARTLHNLATADSGFDLDGVTMAVVDYQRANVAVERRLEFQSRLLDAFRALPGVQSAASVRFVPLTGESWTQNVVVDGVQSRKEVGFNRVSPSFFQTMGATRIAGRDFTPADTVDSSRVAIVNESFARTFLGRRNPIGSAFQMSAAAGAKPPTYEVVGVVRDTKYTSLREPFEPIAFLSTTQERRPLEYVNLVVRTSGVVTARSVADAVTRIEPKAVVLVQSFRAQIADSLVRECLVAMLSVFFGAVAALLAMLGLYGVVAYGVTRRTREIGIRTALGAAPSAVLELVLRQSLLLTAIGVACGVCGAAVGTRYFESMLFGLEPLDPATFILVPVGFVLLSALATYVPARRATRVDPLIALRQE